jgi:hypothetical protein
VVSTQAPVAKSASGNRHQPARSASLVTAAAVTNGTIGALAIVTA